MNEMYDGNEGRPTAVRALVITVSSLLGILVAALLFFIFMVKTNAAVAGYRFITTDASTADVLPSGSLAMTVQVADYGAKENDAVICLIDEKQTLARVKSVVASDDDAAATITAASGGAELSLKPADIVGLAVFYIPFVGAVIDFVTTPVGLVVCVAIPLLILLIFEVINLVRVTKRPIEEEEPTYVSVSKAMIDEAAAIEVNEKPSRRELNFIPDRPVHAPMIGMENARINHDIMEQEDEELLVEPIAPIKAANSPDAYKRPSAFSTQTREFDIPDTARAADASAAPMPKAVVQSAAAAEAARLAPDAPQKPFEATVRPPSESGMNEFQIDGVSVRVSESGIKLNMDGELQNRDIAITITGDCTSVIIGSEQNEVNFAMYKDGGNDRKVIIRRKNRK